MPKVAQCSFAGCPTPIFCRGICKAHYAQQERGEELHPTKAMLPAGCRVCGEPVYRKKLQLCKSHYCKHRHGTLDAPIARPCLNCGESFTPLRRRNAENCSKDCAIETARLRKEYGITGLEVLAMLEAQDHKCAICGDPIVRGRRGAGLGQRGLHIDHCHDTRIVRGLLCGECNRGIGSLRDDPALLDAAAKYLRLSR